MAISANKLTKLKTILSSGKKLLIFNHFNPDPDSITASFILSEIAKHFNVKSKIVYSGKISYSKNLAMVIYLHLSIHLYEVGEEKNFDLVGAVDTQKGMSNNAIPEKVYPQLVFDHHPKVKLKKSQEKKVEDIRILYGSAATILLEYYLELGLKLSIKIATAFCYTIIAETNHFTRKYNKIDVHFYRKAVQKADLKLISKIETIKRPIVFFKILNRAITTYKRNGKLLVCTLGEIVNLDFLHEIANFMLTMDGVEFVAITGVGEGMKKICCRSSSDVVHLGNILKATLKGVGSGGGHETMAAGEFRIKEELVIKKFKSYLKKFRIVKY